MKVKRGHMVWIPTTGSGKVRSTLLNPIYVRIALFLVLICIAAVPVLEHGVLSLVDRIAELEARRAELNVEIGKLQYIRRELAQISSKEDQLKEYFGMSRFQSLKQVLGGTGGQPLNRIVKGEGPFCEAPEPRPHATVPKMVLPEKLKTMEQNYEAFGELMVQQAAAWEQTPSILPVDIKRPTISSGFGWRKNPFTNKQEFHAGVDIIGRTGSRVIAPANGVVIQQGHDRWLGNYLVLQHKTNLKTLYGHLREASVSKGASVKRGDTLGTVGNTGLSTSSHLHYSVVENDRAVDPMQYILDYKG
jgi:murein DD-endopeptidase MepM/ murein hydrolase activator NlpD